MDVKRSSTWLVDGLTLSLAPLDHQDLDRLYRGRLLPMVGPLRARFEKLAFDGDRDEDQAVEALHRCLESFRAILATALCKAQPWLEESDAALLVETHCGDGEDVTLFRQVQRLGKSTLKGLASKHRERLIDLVSLAESFEAMMTMPLDGGEG
ncbi:hypothetical protein ACYOEI_01885 [Singulisphaera rosea]